MALDRANFSIESGRIVGLIGPNGAGKTSALRAILGLTAYEGQLQVLGHEPFRQRTLLMRDACFIADVAVLPSWLRVDQAIDFVAGIHPRFRRDRALALLAKTDITGKRRMRELSKGMKTQVHLALTMAIDAKLLVLDEPTLGLDILARRSFYDALVNDYMDETRTILITTHQVEEVENLLTDVLFINKGHIVLDSSLDDIAARYAAVEVAADRLDAARAEKTVLRAAHAGQGGALFRESRPRQTGCVRRDSHAERFRSVRREIIRRCGMNTVIWLIRREFWENRAIWMIPAVIGGLLILASLFSGYSILGGVDLTTVRAVIQAGALDGMLLIVATFFAVMSIYATWYLLDCLYADRKDRSVLFWKSLPLSDTVTVLCKLGTALIVIPAVYFAAADLTTLVMAFIISVRASSYMGGALWRGELWLQIQALWVYLIITPPPSGTCRSPRG